MQGHLRSRATSPLIPFLLGILVSSLFILRTVSTPNKNSSNTERPNSKPYKEHEDAIGNVNFTPNPLPSNTECKYSNHSQRHAPLRKTVYEWSLSIATTGLLVINIFLWRSTNKANQISRDALTSVQRAFLTCDDILPSRIAQMEGKTRKEFWAFAMPCSNSGNTPANVMTQAFDSQRFPSQAESKEPTEQEFLGSSALSQVAAVGPKSIHQVGYLALPEENIFGRLLAEDLAKEKPTTKERPAALIFWGWVSYRDVLPDTTLHITEFCKKSAMVQTDGRWGWIDCHYHNCADEYCADYSTIVQMSK